MGFHTDLPQFPWDTLREARDLAAAHPGGLIDLSVGTPVDPTPPIVTAELSHGADAPGYPTTHGTVELRQAVVDWFTRVRGVVALSTDAVLPTIGSKELVALLPSLLGLGPQDAVVFPEVAYPTYEIGARLAGTQWATYSGSDTSTWPDNTRVVWVNSPSNPTGAVLSAVELASIVHGARARGAVVVSDECYAVLPWEVDSVPSLLSPEVCDGDHRGLLVAYSLSKQSNLAGYRAAFLAGDDELIARLLELRKHLGMMLPAPVQRAMTVALHDDAHVAEQRERYRARRETLRAAVLGAGHGIGQGSGLVVDHSEAGLYLWVRDRYAAGASRAASAQGSSAQGSSTQGGAARGLSIQGRDTLGWELMLDFARRGILVAPGSFYGAAGERHIRVALTAPDAAIAQVAARLS